MSNMLTIECANPPCNCEVTAAVADTEAYCSHYCQNSDTEEEAEICACGHPQCDAE